MFNTIDPTNPVKKTGTTEPTTSLAPKSITAPVAAYRPQEGKMFSANTSSGNRRVITSSADAGKTMIRNPKTGQYELYHTRQVQAAMERGASLSGGQPMNTQQANYWMKAQKPSARYYHKNAGDNMGTEAKAQNYRATRANTNPGAYYNNGTPALTLRRKGGILYGTKKV